MYRIPALVIEAAPNMHQLLEAGSQDAQINKRIGTLTCQINTLLLTTAARYEGQKWTLPLCCVPPCITKYHRGRPFVQCTEPQ